jgi:RNA polymerase sigma factor (sigma-70 family)
MSKTNEEKTVQSFEQWEIEMVKKRTRRLIGKYGYTKEDVPDLEQELFLHMYVRGGRMRTGPEKEKILMRVLDNKIRDLIKGIQRDKRRILLRTRSLETPLKGMAEAEGLTIEDVLSESQSLGKWNRMSDIESSELRHDLSDAVGKLSSFQQKVFELLALHYSIRDIARRLKVSKWVVHEERNRIREVFEEEGLKDYA